MDLKPARDGESVAWLASHRYAVLSGALALRLVTVPLVDMAIETLWFPATIAAKTAQLALLIFACILAVGRGRALVALGLAGLAGLLFEAIDALWPGATVAGGGQALFVCGMIAWAMAHLTRQAFVTQTVHASNLHAAAAIYLMLGFAFASLYQLVHVLQPGAFRIPEDTGAARDTFLYFSFVTLTTMGYGDITPVTGTARMLAVVEAIAGQIYPVLTVSRLVGMYVAQRTDRGGG